MHRRVPLRPLLALCFAVGCAEGGVPEDAGRARDGGARDAAVLDASRRDGGPPACDAGEHACGTGCIPDLPNEPANGCRLGCGEPCVAPAMGTASCSAAGACDFTCPAPYRREGDACVCAPRTCAELGFECGAPDDGCGSPLDCGSCGAGACVMGRCGCAPDVHEPNDGNATATVYPGTYSDADDPDLTLTGYNLDGRDDEDWIRIVVQDGLDFGNPRMTVTLDDVPTGADYDLAAYYVCDAGGDAASCNAGTSDNFLGRGCRDASVGPGISSVEIQSDCSGLGIDDDGTLYVRVTARTFAGCGGYRLRVNLR